MSGDGYNEAFAAEGNAGAVWAAAALERVRQFAMTHQSFRIEEVRAQAELEGFQIPPSRRAWGAVAIRARAQGWIQCVGSDKTDCKVGSDKSHSTFVAYWKSLIFAPVLAAA